MLKIGLTGSIGMGKSTTSNIFRAFGIPVFDADQTVHDLYKGRAVSAFEAEIPGSTVNGSVSREILSQMLLQDPQIIKKIESIVHPLVYQERQNFVEKCANNNSQMVIFDIPLMFESEGINEVDVILVVSAPSDVQFKRVMARQGMSEEKLRIILNKQKSDDFKRLNSHLVIDTGRGIQPVKRQCEAIIRSLSNHL